ncbi:interferon-induced very large GTPase 1-like [Astyanax mexicanus]|uniref:interferon-induced very large GTPase 1-like n=1 Tax=Astyanax mexicanus TaxID=7994 RepID=UPI0020CB3CD7|nr:interferon-induced very large GTPase 1-like [Astyanax mexicanus]
MASSADPAHIRRRKSMTPPPRMTELRMVLLGKNSSENIRVGNFILGIEAFDTKDPPSSVKQHSKSAEGIVEGRRITLINTLHLFDPELSELQMTEQVKECIRLCSPGPHVLILVLQPGDFLEKDRSRVNSILHSLSDEAYKYTLILKTENKETARFDPVQENILKEMTAKCSNRHLELSASTCAAVVEMSEKIVKENGGKHLIYEVFEDSLPEIGQKNRIGQECGQTTDPSKFFTTSKTPIVGETCSQKTEEISKLEGLIRRLNLSDRYHRQLTVSEFIQITKSSPNCPDSEINVIEAFLTQLLMMDYRARYCITRKNIELNLEEKGDSLVDNERDKENNFDVHPMDVQMAAFYFSENFLKQLIVSKLSQCQYALPLLVPNPLTGEIEFPLWTLRQIKKSWKTKNAESKEQIITTADVPMVAFFRFDSVSASKSQMMNRLINEKHETFFHRDCPGSSKKRLLMDGVVEISWYLPSGKSTDHFSDCVAFCNLHGNAGGHENQYEIVTRMSSVNVVLMTDFGQKNQYKGLVRRLFRSPTPLLCLLTDDDSVGAEIGEGKYVIGLKDRSQYDICQELKKTIKSYLSKQSNTFRLENVAKHSGIKSDEDNGMIKTGKETAQHIMSVLEHSDLYSVKEKYLPFQGKLWYDWCQKNKELHRPHGKNIEMYSIEKKQEMSQIRDLQRKHGLSELMKVFIDGTNPKVPEQKLYLMKWIEILLNKLTTDALYSLHQKYHEEWSKMLELKKTHDTSQQHETEHVLLTISDQLNNASFGLEHILREMGQIFESWQSAETRKTEITEELSIYSLPAVAAELMISGYPLELLDGDVSHVPLIWVSAVLDELIKKLGNQRVYVLSVLGIQSSGKSTMLNAMFGLQFAVSAGRCTRGAFMQLVRVSEKMKGELKFDYILVVDTEGLRALELPAISTRHHDNELATFVVGLGNMTLINIFGENPAEMQDILQIVVQAFLRMKKVRLNPSCMFVHQNVPDITAEQKNMEGRRHLQEKLDEMTKLAAQEESCVAECFNDVIAFDIKKDVRYFAQLWEGTPPMAPQNTAYSENVEELRNAILDHASQCDTLTLTQFKALIKDLWDALLYENFVFSFRNTLEITEYRKLEEKYGTWTWSLRSAMLRTQDKLYTNIKNNQLHKIEYNDLVEEMKDTHNVVKESMKSYFEEHQEGRDLLHQWRGTFEKKVNNLYEELVKQAQMELNEIISQKKTCEKLDEQKSQYETKLFEKSKELALSLIDNSDERQRTRQFDSLWENCVSELTANIPPMKQIEIEKDVIQILSEIDEEALVCGRKQNGEYGEINILGDYTKYVKLKKNVWKKKKTCLLHEDQDSIRNLILTVIKQTKDLVKSKSVAQKGYNPGHIQEIVRLVKKAVTKHKSPKYEFTKEFSLDLSLYVCENAKMTFEDLHKKFSSDSDPLVYIRKKKPEYYNVFQKFCQGATSVVALGGLLCSKLGESIEQSVYSQAANELAEQMRSDLPAFNGNRSNMEKHILKTLAEEEDFEKFKTYILNPQGHCESFIKDTVGNYMEKENSKAVALIRGFVKCKQQCVITAAQIATDEVIKEKGNANMWLEQFSHSLRNELELNTEHLSDKNCNDITDFQLLTDIVKEEIQLIAEKLKNNLNSVSDLKLEKFRKKPDEILIEHFCQCCWVQCSFCKAICTNTLKDHDGDHSVPFHRYCAINGVHYRETENFSLGICTSRVASDKVFWVDDKKFFWREYRTAGGEHAKWSITPDLSELPYWKWFVCRFEKNLETHYKKTFQGDGQIPDEWRKYTKIDAIKSLEKYF